MEYISKILIVIHGERLSSGLLGHLITLFMHSANIFKFILTFGSWLNIHSICVNNYFWNCFLLEVWIINRVTCDQILPFLDQAYKYYTVRLPETAPFHQEAGAALWHSPPLASLSISLYSRWYSNQLEARNMFYYKSKQNASSLERER